MSNRRNLAIPFRADANALNRGRPMRRVVDGKGAG
jgi:hypothetical protein